MGFKFKKIDILGDLIGKAKRRELEGAVRVNLASLGKRLAVGAVAAGIAAAANPGLLGTKPGLLSLGGIGLTAMIPAGAASAGLFSPAQPGNPSVTEALVQAAVNIAQAPADKRQAAADALAKATEAKIEAGVKDGLAKYGPVLVSLATDQISKEITSQFGPGELATPTPPPPMPQSPAETRTGAQAGTSSTEADSAIATTGGNQ